MVRFAVIRFWTTIILARVANCQVYTDPVGYMAYPIGIPFSVNCYGENLVIGWRARFSGGGTITAEGLNGTHQLLPGLEFTTDNRFSVLNVSATNHSLEALDCIGIIVDGDRFTRLTSRLWVSFYGIPEAPENITLNLRENKFSVRWNTVAPPNTTTHLLVIGFLYPSQLANQSGSVDGGTSEYVFELEGNKSCDNFKFGILATNKAGSSEERIQEGFLPPLPNVSSIAYSYTRSPGTGVTRFDVSVSKVQGQCLAMADFYKLEVVKNNDSFTGSSVITSLPVAGLYRFTMSIHKLMEASDYEFRIVSINSLGTDATSPISIRTPGFRNLFCLLRFRDYYLGCDPNLEFSSCEYTIEGEKRRIRGSVVSGATIVRILYIEDYYRLLISISNQSKINYRGEFVQSDIHNCSDDIAMRVDLGYAPRIFVVLYALMAVAVGLSVPIGLTLLVVLYYCFKHGIRTLPFKSLLSIGVESDDCHSIQGSPSDLVVPCTSWNYVGKGCQMATVGTQFPPILPEDILSTACGTGLIPSDDSEMCCLVYDTHIGTYEISKNIQVSSSSEMSQDIEVVRESKNIQVSSSSEMSQDIEVVRDIGSNEEDAKKHEVSGTEAALEGEGEEEVGAAAAAAAGGMTGIEGGATQGVASLAASESRVWVEVADAWCQFPDSEDESVIMCAESRESCHEKLIEEESAEMKSYLTDYDDNVIFYGDRAAGGCYQDVAVDACSSSDESVCPAIKTIQVVADIEPYASGESVIIHAESEIRRQVATDMEDYSSCEEHKTVVMFGDSSAKPPDKAAASGHAPSADHMVIKADMTHITSYNTWYSALSNPEPTQQMKPISNVAIHIEETKEDAISGLDRVGVLREPSAVSQETNLTSGYCLYNIGHFIKQAEKWAVGSSATASSW